MRILNVFEVFYGKVTFGKCLHKKFFIFSHIEFNHCCGEGSNEMSSEGSLIEMLRVHMQAEADMVKVCAELEKKVHTAAAKLLLAEMRLDSVKHEVILREILNVIEKQPPPTEIKLWAYRIESFVDMEVARKELQRHVNVEADMLQSVENVIKATPDEALKVLLSHIAEDERKHHKNIELIIKKSYAY